MNLHQFRHRKSYPRASDDKKRLSIVHPRHRMLQRRSRITNKFLHLPYCGRSENTKTDKEGLEINNIKEGKKKESIESSFLISINVKFL